MQVIINIAVYTIVNNTARRCSGDLEAEVQKSRIWIHDLTTPPNSGNGSILLRTLIDYSQHLPCIGAIEGQLTYTDLKDHRDRLYYFYQKYDFVISDTANDYIKHIKLILNK